MQEYNFHINSRTLLCRISFFFIILLWVVGFSSPLIFGNSNNSLIFYPLIHKIYSGVCHQLEYKSFSSFGYYFHVCARCSGIYIGALIFSIYSLFNFTKRHLKIRYLYFGAIPLLIDVLFQSMNIVQYIKISAFITGLIFGFTVTLFFLSAIENYLLIHKTRISSI